jgi:hypothetical protein
MNAAFLPDFLRGIERSYSNLASDAADYLFSVTRWLAQGSLAEVGMKVGLIAVAVVVISFTLGGAKAMGDKKPGGTALLWAFIALVFLGGLAIALVLIWSDVATS